MGTHWEHDDNIKIQKKSQAIPLGPAFHKEKQRWALIGGGGGLLLSHFLYSPPEIFISKNCSSSFLAWTNSIL